MSPEHNAAIALDPVRECLTTEQFDTAAARVVEAIRDGFESGFKAAGGSIVPDVTDPLKTKYVEIALDQEEIDAVYGIIDNQDRGPLSEPLTRFLEKIELFRRRT